MCQWVNDRRPAFEAQLEGWPSLDAFRLDAALDWLCPLRESNFAEVRDGLWKLAELPNQSPQESGFWPARGPVWDGAAIVPGRDGERGILSVEAKSRGVEAMLPSDRSSKPRRSGCPR